jgi:hypothetical protein
MGSSPAEAGQDEDRQTTETHRFRGECAKIRQGVLLVALIGLIWHTGFTFRSWEEADSSANGGSGKTLNKHKGLT